MGEIWGIPDVVFIVVYTVIGAALLLAREYARRLPIRPPGVRRALHPYEIAYLSGGSRRVIATSLLALRREGAVDAYATGQVQPVGTLRKATHDLDRTIQRAIAGRTPTLANLSRSGRIQGAISGLREELASQGLVRGSREQWLLRGATLLAVVWAALGAAAFVLDPESDDQVMPGILLVAVALVMLYVVAWLRNPRPRTKAAVKAVDDLRERNSHLDPDRAPSYHGDDAMMAAALFGLPAMMIVDAEFVQTLGLARYLALGAGQSAGYGSTSSGGACFSSSESCSSNVCSSSSDSERGGGWWGGWGGDGDGGGGGGGGDGGGGGGGGGCGGGGGGGS
jgi:uncharacterized protein (TIGR04222 family)